MGFLKKFKICAYYFLIVITNRKDKAKRCYYVNYEKNNLNFCDIDIIKKEIKKP